MTQEQPSKALQFIHARIIDKERDFIGSVLVEDGVIIEVEEAAAPKAGAMVLDVGGKALMPAMADVHCHFRDPGFTYKEDILTGMQAAVKGGYAFVAAMANTLPVADSEKVLKDNLQKAAAANICNFLQIAAIGEGLKDESLVNTAALRAYTNFFSNDGQTIFSDEFMKQALQHSIEDDFVLATHCQPEVEIIRRDLNLLADTGGRLHICHVSEKASIDEIRCAREKGLRFTCEATPHHLFASGVDYRVNPPFGTADDVQALIEAVKDGTINILASDHAPHSAEDKQNGSPGLANIESAFGMYVKVFYAHNISMQRLSEMSAYNPRRLLSLPGGLIAPGEPADIILADIGKQSPLDTANWRSKSRNTPFEGEMLRGEIMQTYVNGVLKYDYGQALSTSQ